MDTDKQIRTEVVGNRRAVFKLEEVVIRPCHLDSQAPSFEQPGDLESDGQIDAFFVKAKNAGRAGIFAAVAWVDYDCPRQSASPRSG